MMVKKQATADTTWPSASQIPANKNQTMLPSKPKVPVPKSSSWVSSLRLMASRPNGKNVKLPITMQARPHGMPTIETKAIKPTSHHSRPMNTPPKMNHKKLPIARMLFLHFSHR